MSSRLLLYIAETYENYIAQNNINLLRDSNVMLPVPEAYVIFTGERKRKPKVLNLSDHFPKDRFFKAKATSLELKVKMVYNAESGSIVNQYIQFCRILTVQYKLSNGDRDKAVLETLKICREKNLLRVF